MLNLTELQRDTITELLNIGMGRAAAALNDMVGEEVALSVPSVEVLSRRAAAGLSSGGSLEDLAIQLQVIAHSRPPRELFFAVLAQPLAHSRERHRIAQ